MEYTYHNEKKADYKKDIENQMYVSYSYGNYDFYVIKSNKNHSQYKKTVKDDWCYSFRNHNIDSH